MKPPSLLARLHLLKGDVEPKEIAILIAIVLLSALAVRLSAGNLFPADLMHVISRWYCCMAEGTPAMAAPSKKMTKSSKKRAATHRTSSRKNVRYKKQHVPAATKQAKKRPLQWLFPNANKKARALH